MANYTITHTCGHAQEHQIIGPMAGREPQAARLREQACTDCWRRQQNEAAQAANVGMVALTGSPKQVAWAERIRAAARAEISAVIGDKTLTAEQQAALDRLYGQSSAGWWIDRSETRGARAWLTLASKIAP